MAPEAGHDASSYKVLSSFDRETKDYSAMADELDNGEGRAHHNSEPFRALVLPS